MRLITDTDMRPNEQIVLPNELLAVLTNPLHVGLFVELLKRADEDNNIEISERALAKEFGIGHRTVRTFMEKLLADTVLTHPLTHRRHTSTNTYHIENSWNYKRRKPKDSAKETQLTTQSQPTDKQPQLDLPKSDYEKFLDWVKANAEYVHKNLKPMTETEFLNLRHSFGSQMIVNSVRDLENRRDLRKRYVNLYATLKRWCENEFDRQKQRQ